MSFYNHRNPAGPRDCVVVEESQGNFQACLSQPLEPGRAQRLLWWWKAMVAFSMSFCNHRNPAGLRDCVVVEEGQCSFQPCPFTTTRTRHDPETALWWRKAKVAFRHVILQPPEHGRTQGLCCCGGKPG